MSVSNMLQILNRKLIEHREAPFELPNYLIDGFASENSLKMALKYDLNEAYDNGAFWTAYDPKLNRQVFRHVDKTNQVVGAMGRALSVLQKPKAYIYPNTEKTPWVIGYNPVADNPTAVIVEDILSAVKIYNIGYCGIALSGTVLSPSYLSLFKKFSTIYVCLDKDASIKSFKVKRLLDICCETVIIRFISKDFKDMTRTEAKETLHGKA
jgi:DNA primase